MSIQVGSTIPETKFSPEITKSLSRSLLESTGQSNMRVSASEWKFIEDIVGTIKRNHRIAQDPKRLRQLVDFALQNPKGVMLKPA